MRTDGRFRMAGILRKTGQVYSLALTTHIGYQLVNQREFRRRFHASSFLIWATITNYGYIHTLASIGAFVHNCL